MRRLLALAAAVAWVGGCACTDPELCTADTDCGPGGVCFQGVCFAGDAGAGGGSGGGVGGGAGGGSGGGGGGGGAGGGGGGVVGYCDAGLGCVGPEACVPNVGGGACEQVTTLTWLAPASGEKFAPDASVVLRVRAARADGGDWVAASLPVWTNFSGLTSLPRSGSAYEATSSVGAGPAALSATAGWDGGLTQTVNFVKDGVGPVLLVVAPTPSYGDGGVDFIPNDPVGPAAFRKDELVAIDVTAADDDVARGSIVLAASFDGGAALVLDGGSVCDGGSGFCQRFIVDLSRVQMNDFRGPVQLVATGKDVRDNGGTAGSGVVQVTRWQWARRLGQSGVTGSLKATPAIGDGGQLFVGVANGNDAGLVSVKPDGTIAWSIQDGPVTGSPAIGWDNAGGQFTFFQPIIGTMATMKAARADGSVLTGTCTPGVAGTSDGSLAVMRDGTSSVLGVGLQPHSSATVHRLGTLNAVLNACSSDLATTVNPVSFPGGIVTDGTTGFLVGSNRSLRLFTVPAAPVVNSSTYNVMTSGTVNGLAVLSPDRILGGGGASGSGHAFLANGASLASQNFWTVSPPVAVSGPIIIDGGVLTAESTALSGLQVVLRDADAGTELARSAVLAGGSFSQDRVPTPAAGEGRRVYVADEAGSLFVLRQAQVADGGSEWPMVSLPAQVAGAVTASLALDCNRRVTTSQSGILYLATESGWLVSYIVDSKGLDPTAPWPKYQRDARNTGNLTGPAIACP
jgi:hypothetical protein